MICANIQKLIDYSVKNDLITRDDELVVRNQLMDALGVRDWEEEPVGDADAPIDEILAPLIAYACENCVIEDTSANRDLFEVYVPTENDKLLPAFQNDGTNCFNSAYAEPNVMIVNTAMLEEMGIEVNSYADLTQPQLKGKIEKTVLLRTREPEEKITHWGFELLKSNVQRIRTRAIRPGDVVKIELKK